MRAWPCSCNLVNTTLDTWQVFPSLNARFRTAYKFLFPFTNRRVHGQTSLLTRSMPMVSCRFISKATLSFVPHPSVPATR